MATDKMPILEKDFVPQDNNKTTGNLTTDNKMSFKKIISGFSPRWFIFVMGTVALANVMMTISKIYSHDVFLIFGQSLFWIGFISYPLCLAMTALRASMFWNSVKNEFEHSSLIQFYPAISIAAAIITTALVQGDIAFLSTDLSLSMAKLFWFFALASGIGFAVFVPYKLMSGSHAEPKTVLGFWFLSPVGLFVTAFSGNFLAMKAFALQDVLLMHQFTTSIMGIAFIWGAFNFSSVLHRAFTYPAPKSDVAPSFAIGLAPVGVSIIALNSHVAIAEFLRNAGIGTFGLSDAGLITVMLWGFGAWYGIVASLMIARYFMKGGVPVTLGYWAFVFPISAFTLSTLMIGNIYNLPFYTNIGLSLAFVSAAIWIICAFLTVKGMINGSIFAVPSSFSQGGGSDGGGGGKPDPKKPNVQMFQGKYPICVKEVEKSKNNNGFKSIHDMRKFFKAQIAQHSIATLIGEFDNLSHTKKIGGSIDENIIATVNIVFCFGEKLENPNVLSVRPRSIGIAEYKDKFVVSYMVPPSSKGEASMNEWMTKMEEYFSSESEMSSVA